MKPAIKRQPPRTVIFERRFTGPSHLTPWPNGYTKLTKWIGSGRSGQSTGSGRYEDVDHAVTSRHSHDNGTPSRPKKCRATTIGRGSNELFGSAGQKPHPPPAGALS